MAEGVLTSMRPVRAALSWDILISWMFVATFFRYCRIERTTSGSGL